MKLYRALLIISLIVIATDIARAEVAPKPITQSEWRDKYEPILKLYESNSPAKRQQAIAAIDKELYARLVLSNIKYATRAMEFLLDALAAEKDDKVLAAVSGCLVKFISNQDYIAWLVNNYREIITEPSAKLRLIEVLARSVLRVAAINMVTGLFSAEEPAAVRSAAVTLLARKFPARAINYLTELVNDPDPDIAHSALRHLTDLKAVEKAGQLIKALGAEKRACPEERRADIKDAIGLTLAKITGQSYKSDADAWQKWLDSHPAL
ncbi:MAG: hypothetical protein HY762_08350, partial [Planctomycetes bacterium]|nr:hypothetical protein [Planctomycetota bacterium]